MAKSKRKVDRSKYAWVVFYLYDTGEAYSVDAIGSSKEQAWSRCRRLFPEASGPAWVCRRVKLSWQQPLPKQLKAREK